MVRKLLKKILAEKRHHRFKDLTVEILDLILNTIRREEGASGLVNICLVASRFYLLTVPWLYYDVALQPKRASHARLLDRLAKPGSHLPGLIRHFGVRGLAGQHTASLRALASVVESLKHIKTLRWLDSSLEIPLFMLHALEERFPNAQVTIGAAVLKIGASDQQQWPFQSALSHPVGSHLVSFGFQATIAGQFYNDFKSDLVRMMAQNQVLRNLEIYGDKKLNIVYPEMLHMIRSYNLPRLARLVLYTRGITLFTVRELTIWGGKGGWEKLADLRLCLAHHLMAFVKCSPQLAILSLVPDSPGDYDALEEFLRLGKFDAPFATLRELTYRSFPTFGAPLSSRRLVPWCILKHTPQLQSLILARSCSNGGLQHHDLVTPAVPDYQVLHDLCPELEHLIVDVKLNGLHQNLPLETLTHLVRFEKLQKLDLCLHIPPTRPKSSTSDRMDVRSMARHIRKKRQKLGLPWTDGFELGFRFVAPWAKMGRFPNYSVPSRKGVLEDYRMKSHRPLPSRLAVEHMSQADQKLLGPRMDSVEKNRCWVQMRRRERHDRRARQSYGRDATLYDLWTR